MPSVLDTPPPPPQLTPASSLKGLAGGDDQGQGDQQPGSSQQVVMEHMMEVEKLLGRISDIKPEAAPIIGDLIEQMRVRLGKVLIQPQAQPAPAPSLAGLATGGVGAATPTQ